MKEHDALPSDTHINVKLNGCIHQGYITAIDKIISAIKSGRTRLNLSNLGFIVLPPEIGLLINFTAIKLENNQLISLPSEIGLLLALEQIGLYNNQLDPLPLQIQNLIKLDNLLLNDNQLNSPNNIELIFNSSEKVQNFFKTYFG